MALIDDLEKEGYDTSKITPELVKSLQNEGYDTSSLAPHPSVGEQVMDTVKTATMLPTQGLTKLGNAVQQGFNTAGEKTAEYLGGKGVNPNIAGAAGTAVSMVPDVVGSLPMGGEAAQVAPKVGEVMGSGVNKLRSMAEALTGPGKDAAMQASKEAIAPLQERLLAQQGALSTLPERTAARTAELQAAKAGYGQAIGKAEEAGGFAMKSTPQEFIDTIKDPKALQQFSTTMRKIADTPTADLVKTMDTGSLQTARKFGQTFRELGPKLNKEITSTVSANIKMGAGKSTEALKQIDETFGSAVDAWNKVDSQLDRIPQDAAKQKAAITQATRQTKLAMVKTKAAFDSAIKAGANRDALRQTLLKYGLGGALAGLGWKVTH